MLAARHGTYGVTMKPLEKITSLLFGLLIATAIIPNIAIAKHEKHHPHHRVKTVSSKAAYIGTVHGQDDLTAQIREAIKNIDPDAEVGIQVRSMKSGKTLYALNTQHLFTPASTMKILTAEAALIFLGPNYHFVTQLVTDAKSSDNGLLNGNVWVINSGDPSLTYYDMTDLMVTLKSQEIYGIHGNVYIDNSAYDQDNVAPGWLWKDRQYYYAAPINASIINHNFVSFSLLPGKKSNQNAQLVKNPKYFYADIKNSIVTRSRHARGCHVSVTSDPDNTINLNGCLAAGHYSRSATVVINDIQRYDKSLMQHLFRHSGIHLNGNVQNGVAPLGLFQLAVHESKPLHTLINDMLKNSDNTIAGSLFKKLGEIHSRSPGTWANGQKAVTEILQKYAALNPSQLKIIDGVGLSANNQVTPEQLMRVLDYAFHNEQTSYEFISALPIAGLDGTLKHRLKHIAGRVRAKTGTMANEGISSLAGYAVSKDHEPIAFVVIVNGRKGNVWKYRELEDRIATSLARFTRHG